MVILQGRFQRLRGWGAVSSTRTGFLFLVCWVFLYAAVPAQSLAAQGTARLSLKVFPQETQLVDVLSGQILEPDNRRDTWRDYILRTGSRLFELRSPGYHSKYITLHNLEAGTIREVDEKLEPLDSILPLRGELPTGSQPKSVVFTPDGRYLLAAQLNGPGYDVYRTDPPEHLRRVAIPEWGRHRGFVEWAVLPQRGEIWLSQMTAGRVHVIDLDTLEPVSSFPTRGEWSKVITVDSREQYAYVSNWLSEDISIVSVEEHRVIGHLAASGTPRGMAINAEGTKLYAGIYEGDGIDVFDLTTGERIKTIPTGWGAKRHMVLDSAVNRLYISDMYHGDIWVYDTSDETLVSRTDLAPKLNTIALSRDGRYLFVSSRGRNNPESYLLKGPDFGTISVLDTRTMEVVGRVWGRNQPTGLALSPDGSLLATTDFLDHNLEFFQVDLP